MLLVLAVAVPLALNFLFFLRRVSVEREIRWELYALRDRLRWLGIQDAELAATEDFEVLDAVLTSGARDLSRLTLWSIAPYMAKDSPTPTLLADKNPELETIWEASIELLGRQLVNRHWFLFHILPAVFHLPRKAVASFALHSPQPSH